MNRKTKKFAKRIWHFIWEDDSAWSWIVNIALAFILIKFVVYPGLAFVLGTSHPVVAVVSSSMEHNSIKSCANNGIKDVLSGNAGKCESYKFTMCGNVYDEKKNFSLDEYWQECGAWYENLDISKEEFLIFPYKNGFNKGDIMVLKGVEPEKISQGDILVFFSNRNDPIIHRVVSKNESNGGIIIHTKGDNNEGSIKSSALDETRINEDAVIGKAVIRIPLLGYIKIWFVDVLRFLGFPI